MKKAPLLLRGIVAMIVAGCSSSSTIASDDAGAPPTDDSGSTPVDGATTADGGGLPDVTPPPADAPGPPDPGPPTTLTCPGPGSPAQNGGQCGTLRWSVKTGTDNGAGSVNLLPTITTVKDMVGWPAVTNPPFSSRVAPYETTVWELRDVRLIYARLETDSDYHLVISDNIRTFIAEIPYPATCVNGGSWACLISRSRAAVDAKLTLGPTGKGMDLLVSIAGVGFWDTEHGQNGVAPNGIELHPVLSICFDQGCKLGQ